MVKENSGKIYLIPLEFNLGFALCKLTDYTDIASFDGALVSVLKKQFYSIEEIPSITDIDKIEILFGPLPLNKYPNVKGKGAWKFVGQTTKLDKKIPIFKGTIERVALYKALDWSTVNSWYKIDLNDKEAFTDYENVRGLEMRILYDMNSIELRATMHFLLLNNKKVESFYDLGIERNRNIYLHMINTSFEKIEADKYLKAISDPDK
jgi:hypothetical protein